VLFFQIVVTLMFLQPFGNSLSTVTSIHFPLVIFRCVSLNCAIFLLAFAVSLLNRPTYLSGLRLLKGLNYIFLVFLKKAEDIMISNGSVLFKITVLFF